MAGRQGGARSRIAQGQQPFGDSRCEQEAADAVQLAHAHQRPTRLPLPRYATHTRAPTIGGAAWRAAQRAHALALDGQVCGLTPRGEVRCYRPAVESRSPSQPLPAPQGRGQ
ncbi:hypothetical protein [Thiocystis violacea]|uniref:hypothetical protein n=1 Tax=Thiocystis violacea TaxID=13725 RepID=UPI001903399F|nr:hypothetical protein [Thiocystis violacea]